MKPAELSPQLKAFVETDKRLVEAGRKIKVLSQLTWPESVEDTFLDGWRKKAPKVPVIPNERPDFGAEEKIFVGIMKSVDRQHPIGQYLFATAESYWMAAQMLEARGTPRFTELSIGLYGRPADTIGPEGITHLQAAQHFIDLTRDFIGAYANPNDEYCLTAEQVAKEIHTRITPYFPDQGVEVVVDPKLTSKAAAGPGRVRLRGASCFSRSDVEQLIQHEVFVHTLTALNGRAQPYLGSLALGSPRTTRTQEGLATFAELVTRTIDLARLRRIALRIPAIEMALSGADFVEVFRFFLDAGYDEKESFQSSCRVFRGGDPRGKICFTKDAAYLQGLVLTHTFLRKSVQANKYHYAEYLVAGRLTLGDVVALEPYFRSGFIAPARFEPPWLVDRKFLAAYLVYAVFANQIKLGDFTLEDFPARGL